MRVAYHGHEQQTPTLWDAALAESKYNALNCDLGHYTAAGHDALALLAPGTTALPAPTSKTGRTPNTARATCPGAPAIRPWWRCSG
jgi:hypothetical protein